MMLWREKGNRMEQRAIEKKPRQKIQSKQNKGNSIRHGKQNENGQAKTKQIHQENAF